MTVPILYSRRKFIVYTKKDYQENFWKGSNNYNFVQFCLFLYVFSEIFFFKIDKQYWLRLYLGNFPKLKIIDKRSKTDNVLPSLIIYQRRGIGSGTKVGHRKALDLIIYYLNF